MTSRNRPVRVVVAGVGAVTAMGVGAEPLWERVKAGRSALRPVCSVSLDAVRPPIGGEVPDGWSAAGEGESAWEQREPVIGLALVAAREALDQAAAAMDLIPPQRRGVVVGTCLAGAVSGRAWYAERLTGGRPDPQLAMLFPPQALAEALSGAFQLKGPTLGVATACSAGAVAIGCAADLIRSGQADAVLAGGSEAFTDLVFAGFTCLESLSPEPAAPYSRHRQGLSLGEGSGFLLLLHADTAAAAGVPVLAEVLGDGLSADGYHPTAPHPEGQGAARAIRAALTRAGVAPEQVAYVNGHGTGTPKNDSAETRAIRLALGGWADRVAVSSTKSMIGHLLGAAGAVEAIVTIKALQEQIAPPTAHFREADPACDLDYVPNVARPLSMEVAISNNFAFGGHNASLVLGRPYAAAPPPLPPSEPVVVTGLSAITPAGMGPDAALEAFRAGRPLVRPENGLRLGRAAGFDPTAYLTPRELRRMDRLSAMSVVASRLALQDGGLEGGPQVGVLFGTSTGPMESLEEFARGVILEGSHAANPSLFPRTVFNAAPGLVAMHTGAVGPASTLSAGHASGAAAVAWGCSLVASGQAAAMLCLAADSLTETVVAAYQELGLLAPSSPFALAEAAVALLLEPLSSARARGARIYGRVLGWAIASDALGPGRWDPRGRGMERAMGGALQRAGLRAAEVGAVWANAAGDRRIDLPERAAIRRLFGERTPVLAPKLLFGEPLGAGGALQLLLALQARQAGPVLINSSSLGGTHLSIALGLE